MWLRRMLLSLGLWACGCGAGPAELPAPAPPATAQAMHGPIPVRLPTLTAEGDDLLLDGERVGSIRELASAPGYQLVSGLDEALDARLSAAAGQSVPPHTLRIQLPNELEQQPLVSAFLTASAAGFDEIVAEREAGELRFQLFQPSDDETATAGMQVIWLRLSEKAAHVTRWPDVEEQEVPAASRGPRHAALTAVLRQECAGSEGRCYDVAIVSAAPSTNAGELLEVVEAITEGRGPAVDRRPLVIDFGGRAAGPERDPAAMHATLLEGRKLIQRCYANQLKTKPKLAGRIMIRFMVDRDGSVAAARVTDAPTEAGPDRAAVPALGDPVVTACIVEAVRTFRFEPGGLSTGNFPIVFTLK